VRASRIATALFPTERGRGACVTCLSSAAITEVSFSVTQVVQLACQVLPSLNRFRRNLNRPGATLTDPGGLVTSAEESASVLRTRRHLMWADNEKSLGSEAFAIGGDPFPVACRLRTSRTNHRVSIARSRRIA